MEDKLRLFNNLRRSSVTPSGLPNHWVFGVRHVALNRPGDLVVAVHPQSYLLLQAGPAQILSLPTASAKAAAIIPLLLELFIVGTGSPGGRQPSDPEPVAPWTWSVDDSELVAAIEDGLKKHRIPDTLKSLSVCSSDERVALHEAWSGCIEMIGNMTGRSPAEVATVSILPGDSTRCHGCGRGEESFSQKLMKCSACRKAFYHSQACQRQHWKQHKPTCLANRSSSN